MKQALLVIFALFLCVILTLSSFLGGALLGPRLLSNVAPNLATPSANEPADVQGQFKIFWEAWNLVEEHYVVRTAINPRQMTYGAIRGMLDSLGDQGHTTLLTPEELRVQQGTMSGQFYGIGAQVSVKNGIPVIVAPLAGSQAEKAGIRAGDLIMKVDGENTEGQSLTTVVAKIRGPKGKPVTLTVLHEGDTSPVDITIVRAEVTVPAAIWHMVPGEKIAHIQVVQFSANADAQLRSALQEAKVAGATALIIDMRNDPGGLLDQAVKVSSEFLPAGKVVLLEQDSKGHRTPYKAAHGGMALDLPAVVLVNSGTASAAEIFSGAMQDNGRAKIVGKTTFGTGTVLSSFRLSDGSAILLGVGLWLTPNGRVIKDHGIKPDVEVALPAKVTPLWPKEEEGLTSKLFREKNDTQLLKAVEMLNAEGHGQ